MRTQRLEIWACLIINNYYETGCQRASVSNGPQESHSFTTTRPGESPAQPKSKKIINRKIRTRKDARKSYNHLQSVSPDIFFPFLLSFNTISIIKVYT